MMRHVSAHPPCDLAVVSPQLLIGNELALYRETLAGVLTALRPAIAIQAVPATELDAVVDRVRPLLVICTVVTATIEENACVWIQLHPDTGQDTIVSVRGEQRVIPHPTIDQLVQLVDAVWEGPPAASTG